jgi:hypothetical protein
VEKEGATGVGTVFCLQKIGGIAVDALKDHATGGVVDGGIWMGCTVVEDLQHKRLV